MNLCEPIFERRSIYDSYACRKGKGRLAAIDRAREFCRRNRFFLKMDIRRYFDSVNHEVLRSLLRRMFKDERLLQLFKQIIESYETTPGTGIPIGNLTSQHFANSYLGSLDRFIKEELRCRHFVRYMDDFVVWSDDRAWLPFSRLLGMRIPVVCAERYLKMRYRHDEGHNFRASARGLEPRESRRRLEQQRQELPFRQSQQEYAREPEQQPGLPPRPQLSPFGWYASG